MWDILIPVAIIVVGLVALSKVKNHIGGFIVVFEYEKGLLYSNGKLQRVLGSGRYWLWKIFFQQVIVKVDMRIKPIVITGQEILTKDQINIKVSVIAQFRVTDPVTVIHKLESYSDFLHQEIQLSLRSLVSSRTIDELFEEKGEISSSMSETAQVKVKEFGMELLQAAIRDIILPGDVKTILAKTVEAEKVAKAALITVREELAAARCQANTAKLLQENPLILRLKELQTISDVSKQAGNTIVFTSALDIADLLKKVGTKNEGK